MIPETIRIMLIYILYLLRLKTLNAIWRLSKLVVG